MGLHGKIVHGAISWQTGAARHPAAVTVSTAPLYDGSAPDRLYPARNDNRKFLFKCPRYPASLTDPLVPAFLGAGDVAKIDR
ncbi:hypothetical protein [Thiolapillus sp.]|uniref:hypothetical protein n=1 Tax=Thiolapillus sp. TaxID=2017437 RepID=UPI003AF5E482